MWLTPHPKDLNQPNKLMMIDDEGEGETEIMFSDCLLARFLKILYGVSFLLHDVLKVA